jgi:DNA-directed RNA polymerase subunit M/transcription elongation factor TFIIS
MEAPTIRQSFISLVQEKTKLSDNECKDMEIGVYNWCIEEAGKHKIIRNWKNPRFMRMYLEKARSVISNVDKNSYIGNQKLVTRLHEHEFAPHDIASMKPENLFPERWNAVIELHMKKTKNAYENKNVATTEMFKCGKCKKRECTYYEMFSRSCDEPAVIHIRCLNCGHSWRM